MRDRVDRSIGCAIEPVCAGHVAASSSPPPCDGDNSRSPDEFRLANDFGGQPCVWGATAAGFVFPIQSLFAKRETTERTPEIAE